MISSTMTVNEAVQAAATEGKHYVVLCPSHEDASPSLAVAPGMTQPVVFHCHAGCKQEDIIEAAGLDWDAICNPVDKDFKPVERWTPAGDATAVYPYFFEDGTLAFTVYRVDMEGGKKRFLQCRPDPTVDHGRTWKLDGVRRVLYRLPQVLKAVEAGKTIHFVEGEKCVHALLPVIPEGDEATCNPQGAGKWEPDMAKSLSGANVVIYADSDDIGRVHARTVRDALIAEGCSVRTVEAPAGVMRSGKQVGDVADHLAMGRPLSDLIETTSEAEVTRSRTGVDVLDVITRKRSEIKFAIDDTLAFGERLLLIGFEGQGKSTLCRQMAVMTAAGLHPFFGTVMEPRRVLYIDAENHPDQVLDSWTHLVGLAGRHSHPVAEGMLTILEEHDDERDLTSGNGAAWLEERVHAYKPHLVVLGPLSNMSSRDLRDDETVRRLKRAVNDARRVCNSAFIMEHHAPLRSNNDRERELRPYGSSQFLKWPDYGFGLKPTETRGTFEWRKFRGARVRSRLWPTALREGEQGINSIEWPWMEAAPL